MTYFDKSSAQTLEELKTHPQNGLSDAEVQQRLQQVETRILQGAPGFSNEEVEKELLEEMPWLK